MSELSEKHRDKLDEDQFAFPKERKEPLNNASHVRNAIARFDQVEGVSDEDRDEAWKRIKKAAREHSVEGIEKLPPAHWLEWQNWVNPILKQPYEVFQGMLQIPPLAGVGIDWDEYAVERNAA